MTIDHITINLYTCCKCGRRWTNWDSKNNREGLLPLSCPQCRNVRWNQRYTKEDLILVKRLESQHMIKKNAKTRKVYLPYGIQIPDPKRYILEKLSYLDFIAYYFLYMIMPQPEIFEIKQVLKIPRKKMEQRHDLMLSIIHERIKNREKYEQEHYSKYFPSVDGSNRDRFYFSPSPDNVRPKYYSSILWRRMKGCKHNEVILTIFNRYRNPLSLPSAHFL